MRLLNALRLLVDAVPPVSSGAGSIYYDSTYQEARIDDGTSWVGIGQNGLPDPLTGALLVPDGRQLIYFDTFTNEGILTIQGNGSLVGVR